MRMRWIYQLLGVFDVEDWEYSISETDLKFNRFKTGQFLCPELDSIILKLPGSCLQVGIFFVFSILVRI